MKSILTFATSKGFKLFAVLQGADVLSTLVGFHFGLNEIGPVMRPMVAVFGPLAGLISGKLVVAAIILLYAAWKSSFSKWTFVNFCFALIVTWNVALTGFSVLLTHYPATFVKLYFAFFTLLAVLQGHV